MQEITALSNPTIKHVKKLQQKKYRQENEEYLIEGFHLVEEALKAPKRFKFLLGTKDAIEKITPLINLNSSKIIVINDKIAENLSQTKNSQSIFMVLPINQPGTYSFNYGKWVLLDGLSDPGNVGTIVRTADAAGYDGVVLSPGTVDIYNDKVQRSMQGSQFHIPIIKYDLNAAILSMQEQGLTVYSSVLNEHAKDVFTIEKTSEFGVVIGNEAHGVSQEVIDQASQELYIPIYGKAESLNAGVAAGILMYELIQLTR